MFLHGNLINTMIDSSSRSPGCNIEEIEYLKNKVVLEIAGGFSNILVLAKNGVYECNKNWELGVAGEKWQELEELSYQGVHKISVGESHRWKFSLSSLT